MSADIKHDRSRKTEDEDEDPVDKMIRKTGCIDLHYAVQDCMAEHQDWRKCQQQVNDFRKCMTENSKKKMPDS